MIVHKTTAARPSSLPCLTETPRTSPRHPPRTHTRYLEEKKNPPITVLLSPDFNTTDNRMLGGEPDSGEPHTRPPSRPSAPAHPLLFLLCAQTLFALCRRHQVRRRAEWQPTTFPHPQLPHNHRTSPASVSQAVGQAVSARALSRVDFECATQCQWQTNRPTKPNQTNPTKPNDYYDDDEQTKSTTDDGDDNENNNEEEPGGRTIGRSMPSCSIIEYLHSAAE